MNERSRRDITPNVCYVIPEHRVDSVEHFAHVPRLIAALAERVRVSVVIERGEPLEIPGVAPMIVMRAGNQRSLRRIFEYVRVARHVKGAEFDTYFLRYSRLAASTLVLTRPLFHHRIIYWSSGQADMRDPDGHERQWKRRLDTAWNRWVLRKVDRVVTGPETMVDYMTRRWTLPPRHVSLLYNDVDVQRFSPADDETRTALRKRFGWEHDFVILMVHRLAYRRGSRLLVPIMEHLRASGIDDAKLVVVGDGPDAERVRNEAATSAAWASIELAGAIANRELPDLYRAADCFLMPSYEEGFPRVLLEAMSSALPIVTTSAGGAADIVGSGYPGLVGIGDVAAIATALECMYAMSAAERDALAAGLRERAVARFSTDRVADAFVDLLS